MHLVQPLPEGPLDIVGDVHGEYQALGLLLKRLGYDDHGDPPDGRTLVFVGDLCDRGPDSPAVLTLVQRLVERGRAVAILGNHEINLLRHDAKDGAMLDQYEQWETQSRDSAVASLIAERLREELKSWQHGLDDPDQQPPFLLAHAEWDVHRQMPLDWHGKRRNAV